MTGTGSNFIEVTIREGRNRQVRRMVERVGNKVISLRRTRFASLELGKLAEGEARELTRPEIKRLWKDAELSMSPSARTSRVSEERVFALRGAVQAERNDRESILSSTDELLREMIDRNKLDSERIDQLHPDLHRRPRRGVPGGSRRARSALDEVPLLCTREIAVPGAMERVIRAMVHYYAPSDHAPAHVYLGCGTGPAIRPPLRPMSPASGVNFAAKLDRLPHYEGGMDLERARRTYEAEDVIKLASNESPWGPHPAVLEAVANAAAGANRYPDQYAALLRGRIADRFERDPGGIAVSNGSCEILLAAALALCEPGAELLYAWPSFSMYPQLAPLAGAREIQGAAQRRLRARPRCDGGRDHRRDAAGDRLQPEQPDRHLPVAGAHRRVPGEGPLTRDRDPRRGICRDAGARPPRRHPRPARPTFPNLVLLRTFSKVYGPRRTALRLRAGIGPLPRGRGTPSASPSASTCSRRPREPRRSCTSDDVLDRVEKTVAERIGMEEELHETRAPDGRDAGELLLDRSR